MIENTVKEVLKKRMSDIRDKEVDAFLVSGDFFEIVFKGGPVLKVSLGGKPGSNMKWVDGLDIHIDNQLVHKSYVME